jgi:hypothetical protein
VAAFFGTLAARLGTPLAVIDLMLFAFGPAGVTHFGTLAAKIMSKLRTPTHPLDGPSTDVGAVSIESNTFGHHLHVLFAETGRGTMFAFLRTLDAGCDTGLEFVVRHRMNLRCESESERRTIAVTKSPQHVCRHRRERHDEMSCSRQ